MRLAAFLAYLLEEPGWEGLQSVGVTTRGAHGDTPLHAAVWAGDDEAALSLLDAGAEVDARGEEGYTPLQVAIAKGNAELARVLLDRGASWSARNDLGSTAAEDASRSSEPAVRRLAETRSD